MVLFKRQSTRYTHKHTQPTKLNITSQHQIFHIYVFQFGRKIIGHCVLVFYFTLIFSNKMLRLLNFLFHLSIAVHCEFCCFFSLKLYGCILQCNQTTIKLLLCWVRLTEIIEENKNVPMVTVI